MVYELDWMNQGIPLKAWSRMAGRRVSSSARVSDCRRFTSINQQMPLPCCSIFTGNVNDFLCVDLYLSLLQFCSEDA